MKTLNMPHDYFDLLPVQKVEASELQEGDMALIHCQWSFVLSSKLDKSAGFIDGSNQAIKCINHTGYLPPGHKVNIILRSIIDQAKVKDIIAQHKIEEKEHKKACREEAAEEKERLRKMRDRLNRELGED